jgi:hypothetical protein
MPSEKANWRDFTPDSLIRAVEHVQKSLERAEFQFNYMTQRTCFAELHPVAPGKTASGVFKICMDVYQTGLKEATEKQFRELLEIGLANAQLLDQGPVDWAKSLIALWIHGDQRRVRYWIKDVCDQQVLPKSTTPEEMDEYFDRNSWRAPAFIHMQPSGNTPYDPTNAWSREDRERTEKLLDKLTDRFIGALEFHLEGIAGQAHVQLAKEGRRFQRSMPKTSPPVNAIGAGSATLDQAPVAFISYSWDSDTHKQWVLDLSSRLRSEGGVRIILDRWDLAPGGDRTVFMEKSVAESGFVVLVCTPRYAKLANGREGGVGYEAAIITGELAENTNPGKFIPILRDGNWKESLPRWIKPKLGVDLSSNPYSEAEYQNLLRTIHHELPKAPPVGPKPTIEPISFTDGSPLASSGDGGLHHKTAKSMEIQGKWDPAKSEALIRAGLTEGELRLRDPFYESNSLELDHRIVGEYYLRYRDRESMMVVTASIEKGVNCHACAPRLSLFEFERRAAGWILVDFSLAVARWGQWGQVGTDDVKVFVIGENLYALFLDGNGGSQGWTSSRTCVHARVGDRYQEVLNLQTAQDDSGTIAPGAQNWTSVIKIQSGSSGFYDLLVERRGIRDHKNFAECERFKFNGQKYISSGFYG